MPSLDEALEGAYVLPQIGSSLNKGARIVQDGGSATTGSSDVEHPDKNMRKRGSIGVTSLNEAKAKRAAAAHAHQQQAPLLLSPTPHMPRHHRPPTSTPTPTQLPRPAPTNSPGPSPQPTAPDLPAAFGRCWRRRPGHTRASRWRR